MMNGGYGGGGGGTPSFGRSPNTQLFRGPVTSPYGSGTSMYGSSGSSFDWKRIAGGVGKWIGNHPDTTAMVAGTALGYLGDRRAQGAAEKQQGVSNEQWSQEFGLDKRRMALSEQELQAKLSADANEVTRRRQALMRIFGMEHTPVQGG